MLRSMYKLPTGKNGNVFEKGLKLETKHWHAKPFDYLRYH